MNVVLNQCCMQYLGRQTDRTLYLETGGVFRPSPSPTALISCTSTVGCSLEDLSSRYEASLTTYLRFLSYHRFQRTAYEVIEHYDVHFMPISSHSRS
ncbi:hypothetical protein VTL71DRAFT_11833 [Oculimacula yallundae]|uniref:Uncharacterized protein n=1 Tax=Oculimacula yallundae TaxID=86028 RepID=A0ABR4CRJ6_9HELO